MKKLLISILCLILTSCNVSQSAVDLNATPTIKINGDNNVQRVFKSLDGNDLDFENGYFYTNNFVCARKNSLFYYNNTTNKDKFSDKEYIGEEINTSKFIYQKVNLSDKIGGISVNNAKSTYEIPVNYGENCDASCKNQLFLLDGSVTFTGVLQQKKEGIFFIPYPSSFGDFPFISVEESSSPLVVTGEKSNFAMACDSISFYVVAELFFADFTVDFEEIFKETDLVEANVTFENISIESQFGYPNLIKNYKISNIIKLKNL